MLHKFYLSKEKYHSLDNAWFVGWGEPSKCTLRGMGQEFYRHSRLDEKLSNVPFSSKVLGFQKTLLVSPSLLSKY